MGWRIGMKETLLEFFRDFIIRFILKISYVSEYTIIGIERMIRPRNRNLQFEEYSLNHFIYIRIFFGCFLIYMLFILTTSQMTRSNFEKWITLGYMSYFK